MKPLATAASKLIAEGNRYRVLSCEEAHRSVMAVLPDIQAKHLKLAREHNLRAETFKDAARVIQQP